MLLSGCGRPGSHAPSSRATLVPKGALNAAGEPEWSAQLRSGVLRFTTADGVDLKVRTAVDDHGKAGAVWIGSPPAPAGHPAPALRLSVVAKPCQDASTGLGYPLTAGVEAAGKRYAGCAALPGQGLGPRT